MGEKQKEHNLMKIILEEQDLEGSGSILTGERSLLNPPEDLCCMPEAAPCRAQVQS